MIRNNSPGRMLAAIVLYAGASVAHAADGVAKTAPHCPELVWPAALAAQAQHGTAQLRLLVNVEGNVDAVQLVRSSGQAALDAAARAMALGCRFQPYRVDGKGSVAWVMLPVSAQVAAPTPVLVNGNAGARSATLDLRHCARPDYPPAAQAQGAQGTTYLGLLIGTDGVVQETRLERSSGYPQLDEAARAALGACRFTPALQDGAPVQQWARTSYIWQLDS